MYDVTIIGAGPAGLSAAIYAARGGLKTLALEKQFAGGQITSTHRLENYPGFPKGIGGAEFSEKLKEQALAFGAEIKSAEVWDVSLEGKVKRVLLAGGEQVESKTVILSPGASPRKLGLEREEDFTGAGISYCATCDGAFFKGMEVAVIGGGDTAFEDALYLSNLAKKVTIVHRREEFRSRGIVVERARERENIEFAMNSVPVEILGSLDFEGLVLENTLTHEKSRLTLDGCFIAIGHNPETGFLKDKLELDHSGYVVAGEDTKTLIPGVFVAGDVRKKKLRQVVTAVADGAVAAVQAQDYLIEENK